MKPKDILFRGKDAITGNWAYGYYYPSKGRHIIRTPDDKECIVLKKTLGRYASRKDVNGEMIFEGDKTPNGTVEFSFGCWNINGDRPLSWFSQIEVLGTIHD